MVFQNPDNQIVATIVEEDVAFGPENLGLPPEAIRERVDDALKAVGMYAENSSVPRLFKNPCPFSLFSSSLLIVNADIFPPPDLIGIPILSHGIFALYFSMLKLLFTPEQ